MRKERVKINTFQIEAFLEIADCRSFSVAAKRLFVSQSTLSKTISSLENEYKTELFSRRRNHVELTEAGKIFREYCLDIHSSLEQLDKSFAARKRGKHESIFLGGSQSMRSANLLDPVYSYIVTHPSLSFHIMQIDHVSVLPKLDSGEIDVGICWLDEKPIHGYWSRVLMEEPWELMVSKDNPLAQYDTIDLSQAKKERFIVPNTKDSIKRFNMLCQRHGFLPDVDHRCSVLEASVDMVRHNLGVMFFTRHFYSKIPDGVKLLHLTNSVPHILTILMRQNETNTTYTDFADYFRKNWKPVDIP